MAFLQLNFFSEALHVATQVYVIMPEHNQGIGVSAAATGELPKVLYLLHGYTDDHTIWMRRTSVERYAANHNLAVIMPAVNHSFYCNELVGEKYFDYVAKELPATMHRFLRLSDKPEDTFVAGLSMGGYGTMKLALTYPERFKAAAAFSGALDANAMSQTWVGTQMEHVFGKDLTGFQNSDDDLYHLLKKNADAPKKPKLYLSCGTADGLYGVHQEFCKAVQEAGWDMIHEEIPGADHEWRLWDQQIEKVIPWMMSL